MLISPLRKEWVGSKKQKWDSGLRGEVKEVRKGFLEKGRLEYVFKLDGMDSIKRERQKMRKVK